MEFTKHEIRAMTTSLSAIATALTGINVRVLAITGDDLAYTDSQNIYINFTHVYMAHMTKEERVLFVKGLFSHEVAHMLMTDFLTEKLHVAKRPHYEREIAHTIFNIVEDAAIEYFLPHYLADDYIRALDYTRGVTYEMAPRIDEPMQDGSPRSPFGQFMTAAIQYGDFGILKGHFTDENAKSIFAKSIALYEQAIECPVPAERITYADQITELTRPLWETEAQEAEAMQNLLEEILDSFARSAAEGTTSGSSNDELPERPENESKRTKRRNVTFRRVSREEFEEAKKNSASGPVPDDADIEVLIPDEPIENEDENSDTDKGINVPAGASGNEEKSSDAEPSDADAASGTDGNEPDKSETSRKGNDASPDDTSSGSGAEEDSAEASDKGAADKGANKDSDNDKSAQPASDSSSEGSAERNGHNNDGVADGNPGGAVGGGDSGEEVGPPNEDLILDEDDIAAIDELLNTPVAEEAKPTALEPPPNLEISGGYENVCKGVKAKNIWVKCDTSETAKSTYSKIVNEQLANIVGLVSQFKRIFKNRREEMMYKSSGRISAKRMNSNRLTARVFKKKREPDRCDLAVVVAVDISGSMYLQQKYINAMKTTIALAEVFGTLDIPLYVFGFTADEDGYKANHFHYIEWKNKPVDRLRLLQISARSNNFDGYAIRYGAELLKKRDEENKILIVISDGQPAASVYGQVNGVQDVKLAIKESNRIATTIGILLGAESPEVHREMYGYNFVHCKDPNELLPKISKILKQHI